MENKKICIKCKKSKSLDSYYKNKAMADQLTIYCKVCLKDKYKLRSNAWIQIMTNNARIRAANDKVPFDEVAVHELLSNAPDTCPVFNKPFEVGTEDRTRYKY